MTEHTIAFGRASAAADELNDEQFLQAIRWNNDAPRHLIDAAGAGDVARFCKRLRKMNGVLPFERRSKRKLELDAGSSLWSLSAFEESPITSRLVDVIEAFEPAKRSKKAKIGTGRGSQKRSARRAEEKAAELCAALTHHADQQQWPQTASAFDIVALFGLLPVAAKYWPNEVLFRLWRFALTAAVSRSSAELPADVQADHRMIAQGEVPFVAGIIFGAVRGANKIRAAGELNLRRELCNHTDEDGVPSSRLLERLTLWLAPIVRSANWAEAFQVPLWTKDSQERFRNTIGTLTQLCRPDGRIALTNGVCRDPVDLLSSASRWAGWKSDAPAQQFLTALAAELAGAPQGQKQIKRKLTGKPKRPAAQSDWANLAWLRSGWTLEADALAVAHDSPIPRLDFSARGRAVIEGNWDLQIRIGGQPVQLADGWRCSCWFSDSDCDYMELRQELADNVCIDRQLLLSRNDRFLLLADVVSTPGTTRIEYVSRLPLVHGIESREDKLTRECALRRSGVDMRVFPLALPAEHVTGSSGRLTVANGQLELRQTGTGGLFAPLVFHWHPIRKRVYADWRTLTVTELGTVLPERVAAGHRLRVGDSQLFVYRSLQKTSNYSRAVLGHHTAHETVVGRVNGEGDVVPLVLVE